MQFKDIPQQGGGWFKPAENVDAHAILIEVKSFDRQRPTPNGPKDSVLADMTIFKSQGALDSASPDEVHKGIRIEQTILARDLESIVGSATIVKVAQVESKKPGQRPAWVWRPVEGGARDKVVEYATKREAEIQAALDSAPDFD